MKFYLLNKLINVSIYDRQAKSDFALSVGKQPKSEKYGLKKKRYGVIVV